MNEIKITNTNGVLTVSSLQVAKNFGKRHDHIIRDIESLIGMIKGGLPKIGEAPLEKGLKSTISDYFIESKYHHTQNKQWHKCYDMTRDGFSLLVMGFTGQKALEWKLKYIEAFNSMERQLININSDIERIVSKVIDEKIEITINKTIDKKFKLFAKAMNKKLSTFARTAERNSKKIIIESVSETAKALVIYFDVLIKILNNLY